MDTQKAAEALWTRFVHRTDAYNIQTYSEEKQSVGYFRPTVGTCPNDPPCHKRVCTHIQSVPLTEATIEKHVKGEKTLGVYQLTEDNTVLWGCIDVDIMKKAEGTIEELEQKVREQTTRVATRLHKIIGPSVIVENSGNRGYHVWVLFEEAVQARFVLSLLQHVVMSSPSVQGVSFEVFPKQTALRSFGNQVKLPLGIHRKTERRCLFVDTNFVPYEDQVKRLLSVRRLSQRELLTILEKHKIDVVPSIRIEPVGDMSKSRTGLPCMTRLMDEGSAEGVRDLSMFYLGAFLRDRGIPYDIAENVMQQVNRKNKPPLDEQEVELKVESAFVTDYSPFPCSKPEMDVYCSSKCRFWDTKAQERWVRYGSPRDEAVGRISRD